MPKTKKHYDKQFKQDSVEYYYSSNKTIAEAAKTLNIGNSTLAKWITAAKNNNGEVEHRGSGNNSSDEAKEIARLKKELRDSKDALDILKKAIGILND